MWPTISNISGNIANTIKSYATNNLAASGLNAWVRVYSGAKSDKGAGLILESNTNFKIFSAAGEASIYGNSQLSGTIGRSWDGGAVVSDVGRVLRPSPIITTLNSKEGQDQISRTCDFSITCFSLEQLELIQTYFMEPGYSVGVEWGWNTGNSAKGLIKTGDATSTLNQIADVTLNNGQLSSKRLFTNGEYDIFLGFIIGSTVSSDGENFKVEVRLRGAPSLPTYLQSQNRITVKSSGNEVDPDKSKLPYAENELVSEGDTAEEAKKRRFKYMFNELPAFRQTESVKKLIDSSRVTAFDFINFDKIIQAKIDEFYQSVDALPPSDETEITDTNSVVVSAGSGSNQINVPVPKENLFSTNRYIRFGLAIDILNEIGNVDKYEVGGKSISFKINIDTSIIGAFPYMFSTKKSKLIIPGAVPNIRDTYFLTTGEITQQPNGLISGVNVGRIKDFPVEFVERFNDLNQFGLKEKKGYYGYLKNLYVNFDMFKAKIEQKNKNIREILLDILNEMSSAVNSFWNFQIVEGEFKKTNEQVASELKQNAPYVAASTKTTTFQEYGAQNNILQGGKWNATSTTNTQTTVTGGGANTSATATFNTVSAENDIVITVVDENWIGENPNPDAVVRFTHSGVGSPFLNATLDISIPAEVGAKIINDRLGAISQIDVREVKTGGLFNSETDLFLPRLSATTSSLDTTDTTTPDLNEDEIVNDNAKKIADEDAKIVGEPVRETVSRAEGTAQGGTIVVQDTVLKYYDKDGKLIKTTTTGGIVKYEALPNINSAQVKEAVEAETAATEQRVTTNLEKIDVIPKPNKFKLENSLKTQNIREEVRKNFWVYCLDDTDFLEKMKIDYFEKKGTGALSHPLPIKYSFTILGNSGIRRGDTFKIDGIPRKYAENGIFQVTGIEHSLSGMTWETTVEALYRQIE